MTELPDAIGTVASPEPTRDFSDSRADLGSAGPLLDARAKDAYRQRLAELDQDLMDAERWHDTGRVAQARTEIDLLTEQLASAVGLGGRNREAASHRERARQMVTKRIKAGIRSIGAANPALAHHLSATVKTGMYCSYVPPPDRPIAWTFQ